MTVYVDDFYKSPQGWHRGMRMSHMIADTEEELFTMADRIGVQRKWYQGDHFDISYAKRVLALRAGAVEVTRQELAAIRWCKRMNYRYNGPRHASDQLRAYTRGERLGGLNESQNS